MPVVDSNLLLGEWNAVPQVELSLGFSCRPLLGGYYRLMTAMVLKAKECGWLEADGSQRPGIPHLCAGELSTAAGLFQQNRIETTKDRELSLQCISKLTAFLLHLEDLSD